jgi:hypothetical protein
MPSLPIPGLLKVTVAGRGPQGHWHARDSTAVVPPVRRPSFVPASGLEKDETLPNRDGLFRDSVELPQPSFVPVGQSVAEGSRYGPVAPLQCLPPARRLPAEPFLTGKLHGPVGVEHVATIGPDALPGITDDGLVHAASHPPWTAPARNMAERFIVLWRSKAIGP